MVEVAYPRCAFSQLSDDYVWENTYAISTLKSAYVYKNGWGRRLTAGSRAEGLAMEDNWGHPAADWDTMRLYGDRWGVSVPDGRQVDEDARLIYNCMGCPAAYCRLEVVHPRSIKKELKSVHSHGKWDRWVKVPLCIHYDGGRYWLDTYRTVRMMTIGVESMSSMNGPAELDGLNEYVRTLVCDAAHPDLERRFRHEGQGKWPTVRLTEDILQLPMLLVLVGHKYSPDFKCQARLSWSHCELRLIQELSERVRQGYIACKYVLKYFLTAHRGQNKADGGRSRVGSYHIKTVFLHYLEKTPPVMISSPFVLFIDLLQDLDNYLEIGKLPHYFLPQCNLLETVGRKERDLARRAIKIILSDPLAALLTSPSQPQQIYGEVGPDVLVNYSRIVSTHPASEQGRNDVSVLLGRLDERRQQRYLEQREMDMDKYRKVSERPHLTRLVETFQSCFDTVSIPLDTHNRWFKNLTYLYLLTFINN